MPLQCGLASPVPEPRPPQCGFHSAGTQLSCGSWAGRGPPGGRGGAAAAPAPEARGEARSPAAAGGASPPPALGSSGGPGRGEHHPSGGPPHRRRHGAGRRSRSRNEGGARPRPAPRAARAARLLLGPRPPRRRAPAPRAASSRPAPTLDPRASGVQGRRPLDPWAPEGTALGPRGKSRSPRRLRSSEARARERGRGAPCRPGTAAVPHAGPPGAAGGTAGGSRTCAGVSSGALSSPLRSGPPSALVRHLPPPRGSLVYNTSCVVASLHQRLESLAL